MDSDLERWCRARHRTRRAAPRTTPRHGPADYLFWTGAFALPLAALLPLSSNMLLALKRSVQSMAADRILRPILLISMIAFVSFLLQHEVDASGTMMIWALVSLVALGVSVTWIPKHLPTEIADTAPTERRREWLSVAVTLTLVTNLGLVINKTDVVMLGAIDGTTQAGIYAVSACVADLIAFGLFSVNAIVAPRFSALYSHKQHADMQLLLRIAFRLIVVFTIPVGLLVSYVWRTLRLRTISL